jgi:regulator of sigma E protease
LIGVLPTAFDLVVLVGALALLTCVHEIGHVLAGKAFGVRANVCSFGFGPRLLQWRWGDTYFRISAIPVGGFTKFAGERPTEASGDPQEYLSKPRWVRVIIGAMGTAVEILLAIFLLTVMYCLRPQAPAFRVGAVVVGSVDEGSPAAQAQLRPGDEIVSIRGMPSRVWLGMAEFLKDTDVDIVYLRNAQPLKTRVRLVRSAPMKPSPPASIFGITFHDEMIPKRRGLVEAFRASLATNKESVVLMCDLIGGILSQRVSWRSLPGPLRIAQLCGNALRTGPWAFITLMSMLSLTMAIFNLLPIPILDGGVILIIIIEILIGRDISPPVKEVFTRLSYVIIVAVVTFIIYNDVSKILPER